MNHEAARAAPLAATAAPTRTSSAAPASESKLTPNAQARKRLGEIADYDGAAASVASQGRSGDSFFAWGMPPLKRGLSLADTHDALPGAVTPLAEPTDETESQPPPSRTEAFIDSMLAL